MSADRALTYALWFLVSALLWLNIALFQQLPDNLLGAAVLFVVSIGFFWKAAIKRRTHTSSRDFTSVG